MAEDLVLEEDLLDHLLWTADEVGAAQGACRLELLPAHRRPAALASDLGHHRVELRPGGIRRCL